MLEKAHVELTVTETQRAMHAHEIAQGLGVKEFDGIVTVSGDGLFHEVVNGIMSRDDHEQFFESTTLGIIPGGTANGLAKSILAESDELYAIKEAAFLVAKGQRLSMDLTEYDGEYESSKIYSFLSLTWSIIADCDINSEAIRCCGPPRFTIWGVWRCLFRRDYFADFLYKGFKV